MTTTQTFSNDHDLSQNEDDATEAIFVYGALMASLKDRFPGRAAWLDGYAFRFVAAGVPYLEPSFAAVVPEANERTHGVVFEVSKSMLAEIRHDEDGYDARLLQVHTDVGPVEAHVLILQPSHRLKKERTPSARYLRILAKGAGDFALPHANQLELQAKRGSKLSLVFSRLKPIVVWLTPYLGLGGAILVVLLGLLALVGVLISATLLVVEQFI